jgi:hypothetical protein
MPPGREERKRRCATQNENGGVGFVEALPAYYPTNGPDIEQPRQKFLKTAH